jgi:hypothetical protein
MAASNDFLETLYDEFDQDGVSDSSSFRLIVDLAREGDHGVAAEVLIALVDDGHSDLACELFRAICMDTDETSPLDAPDSTAACRLVEELLYSGSMWQAVDLVDELLRSSDKTDDPEMVLVVEKMIDLGHLDWVAMLCSSLLDSGSPSFAILMLQLVDCGLLTLATQICLELIRDPSKTFYNTQKLRAIRAELLEAGHEACATAICQAVLTTMDTPYVQLQPAPEAVADKLPSSEARVQPSAMEAY